MRNVKIHDITNLLEYYMGYRKQDMTREVGRPCNISCLERTSKAYVINGHRVRKLTGTGIFNLWSKLPKALPRSLIVPWI